MESTILSSVNVTINILLSVMAYLGMIYSVPRLLRTFVNAKIIGIDVNKPNKPAIPEAFGLIAGCGYLVTMFIFMGAAFSTSTFDRDHFPHSEFAQIMAATSAICNMILLGFVDDMLDLRWRWKLLLPTLASIPLLIMYYAHFNVTVVVIPEPFASLFSSMIDLGIIYYVYMAMLAVFCTNAINILAGVNGLEVGQSIVIATSIIIFNLIELACAGGRSWEHVFSLYFMIPFVSISLALLQFNWFPAQIFVGDTYCYFAGMTFAVVGILGHFSKTMLLFFLPQVCNFCYSLPQLARIVPCPRHRMPRLVPETGLLRPSFAEANWEDLSPIAQHLLNFLKRIGLLKVTTTDEGLAQITNLTIINLSLDLNGNMCEKDVTKFLLVTQVCCSVLAFAIRYPVCATFYKS